jgi:hypothetical protein
MSSGFIRYGPFAKPRKNAALKGYDDALVRESLFLPLMFGEAWSRLGLANVSQRGPRTPFGA